jgi:5-methylcytosine-specific restriction endonuclease McrA
MRVEVTETIPKPEDRARANREYRAAWAKANPEKVASYLRKYYEKNLEKRRAAGRERNRLRRIEKPEYDAEVQRRYREANPDRAAASVKKYAEAHRQEIAQKSREWRKANPDKAKELDRLKLKKNPNLHAERYALNKDRMRANADQWRKDHPDKARDISRKNEHKRRARKATSSEHYTLAEIRALRKKTRGKCALCPAKGRMTIDHIIPLARGGSNAIRNIQFLCKPCNSSKQDKDPIQFSQERGLLI